MFSTFPATNGGSLKGLGDQVSPIPGGPDTYDCSQFDCNTLAQVAGKTLNCDTHFIDANDTTGQTTCYYITNTPSVQPIPSTVGIVAPPTTNVYSNAANSVKSVDELSALLAQAGGPITVAANSPALALANSSIIKFNVTKLSNGSYTIAGTNYGWMIAVGGGLLAMMLLLGRK